ncbi:MAG: hypothetical protein R3A52_05690 [Polyangiales bacterium]
MRALMLLALALAAGCTNYRDQLDRADAHYHAARYEHALSSLETSTPASPTSTATGGSRYLYLRGDLGAPPARGRSIIGSPSPARPRRTPPRPWVPRPARSSTAP